MGKRSVIVIAVIGLLVAADGLAQAWAMESFSQSRAGSPPPPCSGMPTRQPRMPPDDLLIVIPDVVTLRYAENCGSAFGGETLRVVRHGAPILLALGVLVFAIVRRGRMLMVGACFLVAGTMGAGLDQLRLGYVVDFIQLGAEPAVATFGLAEVWTALGLLLIPVGYVLALRSRRGSGAESETRPPSRP